MVRPTLLTLSCFSFAAFVLASPPQIPFGHGEPIRTTEKWDYKVCGSIDDTVDIQSIMVSPDPPHPGKDLTVTVVGNVKEVIEDGAYASVEVKLGLIKLLHKTFDICHEARNANVSVQCPVEKGPYTVEHTVKLPKEIPPAKFDVHVRGYTNNDDPMFCLDLKVDFMIHPFLKSEW